MCIDKNNCICLSTPRKCDASGPFVAIDIKCINTPVGNNEGSIISFSSGISNSVVIIVGTLMGASLIGFGTATNARVDLAPPVAGVPAGITFGSAEIEPVHVSVGDRLLMVFFISSVINPPALITTVTGNASAGINIV
ncbi:hypothetical protein FOH38_01915 [Lysinibacillus fusiformis]|nr:hypothetical protein FOH38_01915 [Lysinibacillus fusiformis]